MFEFLSQHQFSIAVVLYWIFSAAISSMPEPTTDDAPAYSWLYRFLHTVAGNLTTAFGSKIPGGVKTVALVLVLPLVLSSTACAAVHYTVHPGAVNKADSISYDTLLVAETAIDEARHDFETGRLPNGRREAFETLVRTYNLARQS